VEANGVVIGEVQGESCIVVFPLLREGVCEARESANLHSHAEVLTLYMRSANLVRVGVSDDWEYLR